MYAQILNASMTKGSTPCLYTFVPIGSYWYFCPRNEGCKQMIEFLGLNHEKNFLPAKVTNEKIHAAKASCSNNKINTFSFDPEKVTLWILPLDPKTMKNEGFKPPIYGL